MKKMIAGVAVFLFSVAAIPAGEEPVPAVRPAVLSPPFVLDCGPPGGEAPRERDSRGEGKILRLRDRFWSPEWGYGFEDGEGYRHPIHSLWGDPEIDLFLTSRRGPGPYRFAVPPGRYLVTFGFCELEERLPGRRTFDVLLDGKRAIEALDPFAIAGFGQAFRAAREVEVGEDGLQVGFKALGTAPPEVCAIWVEPARSPSGLPPPLSEFRVVGSYRLNWVAWTPPGSPILGIIVERRAEEEKEFIRRTALPVPASRWIDRDVKERVSYEYRAFAVGLDGRAGPPCDPVLARTRSFEESALPVYFLEIAPDALARLLGDVRNQDRSIKATFSFRGGSWPVKMRIRGGSTRLAEKLSYRIEFDDTGPFPDRPVICLKAEPFDFTLQEEKLTCDLLAALGLKASRASYAALALNGRYEGIYLDIEPVGRPFLDRVGLKGGGKLIRPHTFGRIAPRLEAEADSRQFAAFLRQLNGIGRGEVEKFLREETDWPAVRDHLVGNALCDRPEIEADDTYWHQDPDTEKWSPIGWDFNNGHFGIPSCYRRIVAPRAPLYGQTVQGVGFRHGWWHLLPSRAFECEALRREFLDRLEEKAREILLSGAAERMMEANFAALRPEVPLDPFRWPPGEDEPFLRSAEDLRGFIRDHGTRLLARIAAERSRAPDPLVIDEIGLGADGGWVEVANRSAEPVSLTGCALTAGPVLENGLLRFKDGEHLGTKERRVVAFPLLRSGDAGSGIDPSGGLVALVRFSRVAADRDDREERPGEILDLFFHGPLDRSVSYGRAGSGFGFLRPTPGAPNPTEALEAPPFLKDGGAVRVGKTIRGMRAWIPAWTGKFSGTIVLHYRCRSDWKKVPMPLYLDRSWPTGAQGFAEVDLDLEQAERQGPIEYWFEARSRDGVVRRIPPDAPRRTLRKGPWGDDD
jgi:spore coat protein H